MIIEENELRVAYKNLYSLVSDVRICVGKPIEYPAEEVSLIAYLKEKLLEYDKYRETMEYLLNRMKETNKAFKQGIMIEKKLLPSEHKVIEERAQVILNECPYLDLIGEVGHLYSALRLLRNEVSSKLETRKMVSSEQNREPIMDKIQIKEETSRPKQVDAGSAPDYFTSDEEIDSSISKRIARKPKERTIKFHRNVNKPIKNQTPHDTKESGNTDPVITGAWSIEDLIKLVTTLTKNTNEGNRARFPEIKIPIYNGDKDKYEEFWAVFHQMVHSNISFSPIEKFLYLTNSLTDKAAEAIRGITIIDDNYQQAIDIIKEKFGNRQDNEACIAKQLKNLEPASKSIRSCRQVFNKTQSLIQQLKAVGRDISKDSDPLWKEIIYDKFPNHIREKVYMAMKRDKETKWTINKMISYIDDLIAARETYEGGEDVHSESESNKKPYQNDIKRMAYKSNPITCRFCQQGHKDAECKTHRTPEERRNSLRNRRICWKCFSTYHTSWKCTKPNCSQCGKEHHRLLCLGNSPELSNTTHNRETSPSSMRSERRQQTRVSFDQSNNTVCESPTYNSKSRYETKKGNNSSRKQQVFMTAEAEIFNHKTDQYEKTIVFFDNGSHLSFIQRAYSTRIGLKPRDISNCTLSGLSGKVEKFSSETVLARFRTKNGCTVMAKLLTKQVLTRPFHTAKLSEKDIQFLKGTNVMLSNPMISGEVVTPKILIGLDLWESFMKLDGMKLPSGFLLQPTIFGNAIYGSGTLTDSAETQDHCAHMCIIKEEDPDLRKMLRSIYSLEGLGITEDPESKEEETFQYMEKYSKLIQFTTDGVIAPFPLKESIVNLKDNFNIAFRRLENLLESLRNKPEQIHWYEKILQTYIKDGIIEIADDNIQQRAATFYLPHRGVWKPEKATPLRIVFDASQKSRSSPSLNDCIYEGLSFINMIHEILIAARWGKIMITADVQAAFVQIRLPHEHRDLTRFLWVKDIGKPLDKWNLKVFRFSRVPFGINASPSILNMTICRRMMDIGIPLAIEIMSKLYVDNIILEADDPDMAINKYKESKEYFRSLKMNLRDFISNNQEVNEKISSEDKAKEGPIKLLGIRYNTKADMFCIEINFPKQIKMTKRSVISQIHSVFDPIGLTAPLLLQHKLFLRNLFDKNLKWDEPLNEELIQEWNTISADIHGTVISVPRRIGPTNLGNVTSLWVFVDASAKAYACCAYLAHDNLESSGLVSGKSRLTPIKGNVTIPRLELIAILLGMRLTHSIISSLNKNVTQVHIVSDSKVALTWLLSSRCLPIFVRNQVKRIMSIREELLKRDTIVTFHYIPTEFNPSDVGTRGCKGKEINSTLWINGPAWCRTPTEFWPVTSIEEILEGKIDDEFKDTETCTQTQVEHIQLTQTIEAVATSIFPTAKVSSFRKLLRIGAYALLFINKCARKVRKRGINVRFHNFVLCNNSQIVTADEINMSETWIIRNEIAHISLEEVKQRFLDRYVFQDSHGLIRYQSRIQRADLDYDTKNPIFIPKASAIVRLILGDMHIKNGHCGKQQLITAINQKYWIPSVSRLVQGIISQCVICKRINALPFTYPAMGPLPADRVIKAKPFMHSGLDFLGPYACKEQEKIYICLFTCLTTRAVHLECVENLSAGAFLRCLQRFFARRGVPKTIRSDQGRNFVLAERVLSSLDEVDESTGSSVNSYMATERIKWIFNPPNSPWMGGIWERLVQSVKRAYTKMVGRKKITIQEMITVMTMIEAILNTRPITHVNPSDVSNYPIRPVDFLSQQVSYSLPSYLEEIEGYSEYNYQPIKTMIQAKQALDGINKMADKFWKDWNTRYLTELRNSHKIRFRQGRHGSRSLPEFGEVVLVENELTPRSTWYYGIVVEIIQGADGQVRSAKLKCPNGRILHRPINKLYPMEIRAIAPSQSIPTPAELGDPNLEEEVDEEEEERLVHTHQLEAEPTREYSSNVFINTKKYWPTKFSSNLPSLLSIISILSLVITEASEATEKIECIEGGFRLKHLRAINNTTDTTTGQSTNIHVEPRSKY